MIGDIDGITRVNASDVFISAEEIIDHEKLSFRWVKEGQSIHKNSGYFKFHFKHLSFSINNSMPIFHHLFKQNIWQTSLKLL